MRLRIRIQWCNGNGTRTEWTRTGIDFELDSVVINQYGHSIIKNTMMKTLDNLDVKDIQIHIL